MHWKHKATGATASLYGAVPWSGAKGDEKSDWEKVEVGWTIRHPDGTIGIGQKPFHTKEEAEKWVEAHPKFTGMNVYANDRWKTAAAMPDDNRLEGALQMIERDVKDIRYHLSKTGPKRPYDDMGVVFGKIASTAEAMRGRIADALPEWKKQTGRV